MESSGIWESNSSSEDCSDEGFEIVEFDPDRDKKLNENDRLQGNHIGLSSCDDEKWRLLGCHNDQMNNVATKLDQLLRAGKNLSDQIFYKYLLCDNPHTCDPDFVEFFSTILYLGGKVTFNFFCGPMFYGQGKMLSGNRDFRKIRMNIGGPSESLWQKWNTDFMCKLGILNPFVPNAPLLYPLKTSGNREVF